MTRGLFVHYGRLADSCLNECPYGECCDIEQSEMALNATIVNCLQVRSLREARSWVIPFYGHNHR